MSKLQGDTMKKLLYAIFTVFLALSIASCGDTDIDPEKVIDSIEHQIITLEDMANYIIIRPEEASDTVLSAAIDLRKALSDSNIDIELSDDFYREGSTDFAIGEYEILIGKTNRPESVEFCKNLRKKDYGYKIENGKILISGGSDESTEKAVDLFIENVVNGNMSDGVFYSSEYDTMLLDNYALDSLTVGNDNTSISEFSVVYSQDANLTEYAIAEMLVELIDENAGFTLSLIPDSQEKTEHEILVGNTSRSPKVELESDEYCIEVSDGNISLLGCDTKSLIKAYEQFSEMLEPNSNKSAVISDGTQRAEYDYSEMTAMSYNISCNTESKERMARVVEMMKLYMPDTIGIQEATKEWMDFICERIGDIYDYVGEGRDGGTNGEYSSILYNKTLFNLLDSGTKWLSDTPDIVSKVPESSLNRVFSYALLERKADGQKLMVVNTHLEHTTGTAREKQAEVLKKFISEYIDEYPVILTGDFNGEKGTNEYNIIISSGLSSSSEVADTANSAPTYTNYSMEWEGWIIDYAFINDNINVKDYTASEKTIDGECASDHQPIIITYSVDI